MSSHDQRPNTQFTAATEQFLAEVRDKRYAVLCGRNNCGKSYLLKVLAERLGEAASYLGPARYQNFNVLSPFAPTKNKRSERFKSWLRQWRESSQNIDNSPFSLQQAIAELSDAKRAQLIEIMDGLLSSKMQVLHTIPDNSMSQQYVSVNGYNLSYSSSGYRLIASLVTSLLSAEHEIYLVDEPELGISPEAQGAFAEFLFSDELRKKYFPHIRCLVFATHSTMFLDRYRISNNYFVTKEGATIDISPVASVADINRVHFFLLGNRLESLYMPSAVVIVEGKTDHAFIERVLAVTYPNVRFSVMHANSDSRIRDVFNVTKNVFGDLQKSPYRERILAVIDAVHGTGLIQHLESMGMPRDSIIVWKQNGIEFYYPPAVLREIFHSAEPLQVVADRVRCNGLEYSKSQLSEMVVSKLQQDTTHDDAFSGEFLSKVRRATGI